MKCYSKDRCSDKKPQERAHMTSKFFNLLTFSIGTGCILLNSDPVQSSYCSGLYDTCRLECNEIRLDDFLQKDCYDACDNAFRQCEKKHPESRLDRLEEALGQLKMELGRQEQRDWELRKELDNSSKE